MTGCLAWIRSKITRPSRLRTRATSPSRPAPSGDGPRPLPDPQNRGATSESSRPEHDTRASASSVQPSSSPSPEDISVPVVSPGPDQVSSPAHPVSTLSETQSDSRTSDVATAIPSQSSMHVAPSWSQLRNIVGTALRVAESVTDSFPPAKAAIAGVIEILKIVDVSCIGFH